MDNGATDGSPDYIRLLRGIILIANPANVGAIAARNQALSVAKGDSIVFLDNDVVVTVGGRRLRTARPDGRIRSAGARGSGKKRQRSGRGKIPGFDGYVRLGQSGTALALVRCGRG